MPKKKTPTAPRAREGASRRPSVLVPSSLTEVSVPVEFRGSEPRTEGQSAYRLSSDSAEVELLLYRALTDPFFGPGVYRVTVRRES